MGIAKGNELEQEFGNDLAVPEKSDPGKAAVGTFERLLKMEDKLLDSLTELQQENGEYFRDPGSVLNAAVMVSDLIAQNVESLKKIAGLDPALIGPVNSKKIVRTVETSVLGENSAYRKLAPGNVK